MRADDPDHESFEEIMRSIVLEVTRSVQERAEQADVEEVADTLGVDPALARQWVDGALQWVRAQAENLGNEVPFASAPSLRGGVGDDSLDSAGPHPLDLPTDEHGLALAALSSGRWTVEPGSNALAARGDGPGPSDALGLVRELRARDWINAEGELTLVGRHALSRWLEAAKPR
jgi:hypothetical protein